MLTEDKIKEAYCELAGKLTNYLIAGGMDYASACDITQESFIRLWKRRETLSEHDSVSGFIFAVAKNLQIDHSRRNKFIIFQDDLKNERRSSCGLRTCHIAGRFDSGHAHQEGLSSYYSCRELIITGWA